MIDRVSLDESDPSGAWVQMFDTYKQKTQQTDEQAWDQMINQYKRTHPEYEKDEDELPFKTIAELITDYFANGEED